MTKNNGLLTKKKVYGIRRIYLSFAIVATVMLGSMSAILFTVWQMTAVNQPLINAAMKIQFETTTAHLWFEELISGDRQDSIDTILEHIDKAHSYASAMLKGGQSPEGKIVPLKEEHLQDYIKQVTLKIEEFRKITLQRWEQKDTSGIGSEIDQKYDSIFNNFIEEAENVESELRIIINRRLRNFLVLQVFLIGLSFTVLVLATVSFRKLLLRQIDDEAKLLASNQQLDASNQQLKAGEQQLGAANQQLLASDQQLRAANQQLLAEEQQLRAANQQLLASEQQLRAANQQLTANEKALKLSEEKYRKSAESLAVSQSFLNATGQTAKVGGWELYTDTLELNWTDQTHRIYELPLDQKPVLEEAINYFHPDDRAKVEQVVNRAMKFGEPFDIEVRLITAKGNEIWANVICKPHVVDGKTVKLTGTFQDMTERKKTEQEREKLMRMINSKNEELQSIVYISSHDLRAPLVNIKGFSGLLTEHCEIINDLIEKSDIDKKTKKELTPLDGLVMATRCGDIDPSVVLHLLEARHLYPTEIDDLLNRNSGLKGLCGKSDMREIIELIDKGDKHAQTAVDVFVYRIQKYIGAYAAALNGVDAIVFTGGIGENSSYIRQRVIDNFCYLGARVDCQKNEKNETVFSAKKSPVSLLNIPANEELIIAKEVHAIVTKITSTVS